jgi:hypothetical protein
MLHSLAGPAWWRQASQPEVEPETVTVTAVIMTRVEAMKTGTTSAVSHKKGPRLGMRKK